LKFRSPLGESLGLGAAGDGPAHWWAQRVSAVGVGLLTVWFLVSLTGLNLGEQGVLVAWISAPVNSVLAVLLVVVTAYHSNLGVQEVIVDYVGGGLRVVSLVIVQFLHIILAGIGIAAILRMAFGDSA
jgi:succinate dehydrogenase / fumarate reductase membrane anchor subunit